MRQRSLLGLAMALLVTGLASTAPAEAGCRRCDPFYSVDYVTDPYAYRYEPRGYYPYYNSRYWRPAAEIRWRRKHRAPLVIPPYYQAWGYPKRSYVNRDWRWSHDGYVRHEHW